MVGGCEEPNRSIMDWCADSPSGQNEVSARLNLWRNEGKGPCPVKNKTSLHVQLIGFKLTLGTMLGMSLPVSPSSQVICQVANNRRKNVLIKDFGNSSGVSGKFSVPATSSFFVPYVTCMGFDPRHPDVR
ncbi:hypothetical protein AVEN_227674-1 [Araneus ventricosus]|uniref:Uncharacterized protein n=1 Tax=Araneus ventricosus TaxID=182803 RepID=A0A4Y2LUV4_ARAVE|nr:hypothetical protein AVEN_227674-1 [Araneus ventricosus]